MVEPLWYGCCNQRSCFSCRQLRPWFYKHYKSDVVAEPAVITANKPVAPTEVVKVIDFENTALPVVISKIKEVYGVEVINVPENAETYYLSLHYEGNAVDLVLTINEILDTEMRVKE